MIQSASDSTDTITDFVHGTDHLKIVTGGFGGDLATGMDVLATGRFVTNMTGKATSAQGQFAYKTGTGRLWWDADGTGAGSGIVVAALSGKPVLDAADIWIF